jgi:hypothetical protein
MLRSVDGSFEKYVYYPPEYDPPHYFCPWEGAPPNLCGEVGGWSPGFSAMTTFSKLCNINIRVKQKGYFAVSRIIGRKCSSSPSI